MKKGTKKNTHFLAALRMRCHQHKFFLCALVALILAHTTYASTGHFGGINNLEYVAWVDSLAFSYNHRTYLPSSNDEAQGVAMHWSMIDNDKTIRLAVAARATGWVGFGISEAGGMRGADVALFLANGAEEEPEVIDSYVLDGNMQPIPDDCQSWSLLASQIGEDFIMFEAVRAVDTGDGHHDREFSPDGLDYVPATRVIAAWGDSSAASFHGADNHARGSVRFFMDYETEAQGSMNLLGSFAASMQTEAEGSFSIEASNFNIPTRETTYENFCFLSADMAAIGLTMDGITKKHIVGIEPFIDSHRHVHHFVLYGAMEETTCSNFRLGDVLYTWAPGSSALMLPKNVGIPLDGTSGYLGFRLQVHYDNSERASGVVDNSGVVLHYTTDVREHDMGVLQIGDPFVQASPKVLTDPGGPTQHLFICPSTCTQFYFRQEVTVFLESLHMHQNGKMARTDHLRDGRVVRSGVAEYYDFEQQGGIVLVQKPFSIQPGDAFRTVCSFDAEPGERWGASSSDEMCIGYFYYYPRQLAFGTAQPVCGVAVGRVLPGCEAEYSGALDLIEFDRTFGSESSPTNVCLDPPGGVGEAFAGIINLLLSYLLAVFLNV